MYKELLLALALIPLTTLRADLQEVENQLGTQARALEEERSNLPALEKNLQEDVAAHKKVGRELQIDKGALKEIEEEQAKLGRLEKAFILATMRETKSVGDRALQNQKALLGHLDELLDKKTFENVRSSVPKIDEALSQLQTAASALSTAREGEL